MSVVTDEFGVIVHVSPRDLSVCPPFSTLFPIDKSKLDAITRSMREDGFDPSRPINVWRQGSIVVDGHTRREAAIAAGITDIPVCFHEFTDEDAAVVYAIKSQVDRRQLTDAEVYRVTLELDKRRKAGRPSKEFTSHEVNFDRSSKETASQIHVSPSKVEAVRIIEGHADRFPDIKEAVVAGEKSIRMGAREISDRKRKEKPAYVPVVPPPVAGEMMPDVSASSKPDTDDAEQAWLESHAIRSKVVARRFDDDAMIVRLFGARFGEIKAEALRVIGWRADHHASPLFRALMRLADVQPIGSWSVCEKCEGKGAGCRACGGGGYVIPGFERK